MRETVKSFVRAVALVVVLPVLAYYGVARRWGGDRALEGCSQLLALIPGLTGQYLRRAFLARAIAHCGETAVISFGVILSSSAARIENGAYVGPFCTIGMVHIEADTLIAAGAQLPSGPWTHGTAVGVSMREQDGQPRLVRIGPGAWVGNNAVIMADVGKESIVGAGAVVTKPVPPGVVVAGVPARIISTRSPSGADA
jgi:acetyltransferase-like isoleucine patch superfamily enzyme